MWLDIYQRYRKPLYATALRIVRREQLAEDAVHDAFVKLYSMRGPVAKPKVYAFTAVRNAALTILRRQRETPVGEAALLELASNSEDPVEIYLETNEQRAQLNQAMSELSDLERETILLHIHGELKFREIAEVLHKRQGTVASSFRRGIEKLRELMTDTVRQE